MENGVLVRFGGISGILFVVLVIPLYIVGTPDAPSNLAEAEEVVRYFAGNASGFLIFNGVFAIFCLFFFLWFLGILRGVLRGAEGEGGLLSSVALAGGLIYAALVSVGWVTEIAYPAAETRFVNFEAAQLGFLTLVLAAWSYVFANAGMSVLVSAASLIILRTGILPRWLALFGLVAALLALLAFLIPPYGGMLALLWVVVLSALMLVGSVGPGRERASRPERP